MPALSRPALSRPARGVVLVATSRVVAVAGTLAAVGMLPWLTGTDPAYTILRARAGDQLATADALARIRAELDLAASPVEQLRGWLAGLVRGDLGTSWVSGAPVLPDSLAALGVSLTLMGFAALVAALVAAALVAPTLRAAAHGLPRPTSGTLAAALVAVPEFLLATALVVVAAVWWGLLPPYGWDGPRHAVAPALALGVPAGGYLGRLLAEAVAATAAQPWVATWTLSGIPRRTVGAAVLRAATIGLLPQVALVAVGLTGGAVAVERVFAVPGLGRATLGAAAAQDLPALQAGLLLLLGLGAGLAAAVSVLRGVALGPALRTSSLVLAPPRRPGERGAGGSRRRAAVVVAAAGGALLALVGAGLARDPTSVAHARLAAPSPALPFGADAAGRDLLARVGHGAATTIGLALALALAGYLLGLVAGLVPAASAGPVDVANACPPVVVGLLVAGVAGPTGWAAALAVLLVGWAPLAAHTAALAAQARAQPHVRVLPLLGVGRARVLAGYVVPVVAGPVLGHALLRVPGIALSLAALGFLGLGPQPPAPDWGLVLAEGTGYVERAPWAVLAPTGSLVLLTVLVVAAGSLGRPGGRRRGQ